MSSVLYLLCDRHSMHPFLSTSSSPCVGLVFRSLACYTLYIYHHHLRERTGGEVLSSSLRRSLPSTIPYFSRATWSSSTSRVAAVVVGVARLAACLVLSVIVSYIPSLSHVFGALLFCPFDDSSVSSTFCFVVVSPSPSSRLLWMLCCSVRCFAVEYTYFIS